MLNTQHLSEPFTKLPPDGPLQKLNIHISKCLVLDSKPVKNLLPPQLTIEELQKELMKSQEREQFLHEELLVVYIQMSARIISEQDRVISLLTKNDKEPSDIEYLDDLKQQATFLAWSSEMLFSTEHTEESPSVDEIP